MLVAAAATVFTPESHADHLYVTVTSGRTFAGDVSARTGEDRLWLRMTSGGVELLRPVDWRRIVGGRHEGRELDSQQIREVAFSLRSVQPESAPSFSDETPPDQSSAEGAVVGASLAEQARGALGFASRIRTVEFDAYLANWDADVEADGLIVHVLPLDEYGGPVVAEGTIDVTLLAFQRRDLDQAVRSRGESIERIGQWTRRLDAESIGPHGAVFKLPYQAIHPEFDTVQAPLGIVNLRLAAPGHGVFEDSLDDVRIRRYSAVRDSLQRHEGRRFHPVEQTNRGR